MPLAIVAHPSLGAVATGPRYSQGALGGSPTQADADRIKQIGGKISGVLGPAPMGVLTPEERMGAAILRQHMKDLGIPTQQEMDAIRKMGGVLGGVFGIPTQDDADRLKRIGGKLSDAFLPAEPPKKAK
jgi:hypothetical protein